MLLKWGVDKRFCKNVLEHREKQKIHIFLKNHKIWQKNVIALNSFEIYLNISEISEKVKFLSFWSHDPPIREKIGHFFPFFW